jgi:hypothetical protein
MKRDNRLKFGWFRETDPEIRNKKCGVPGAAVATLGETLALPPRGANGYSQIATGSARAAEPLPVCDGNARLKLPDPRKSKAHP